jgi:hypothetical protein
MCITAQRLTWLKEMRVLGYPAIWADATFLFDKSEGSTDA